MPRPGARRPSSGERGQILPFVAVLIVALAVAGLLLVRLSTAATEAAAARTAADAAALAGAVGGREAAVDVAEANGARVVGWRDEGGRVVVAVRLGEAEATAAATVGATCVDSPGSGVLC